MTARTKPRTPTARELLQPSVLRETQLELMGDDVDLSRLYLKMQHQSAGFNMAEAVTDVVIHRTIDGSSTVTVIVEDRDRILLQSGKLSARNDIEIDGLYFRLVSVSKSGVELTLVFEDREVALLRTYAKPIKQSPQTSRGRMTRAQFVLRLIKEVKETKIRYVIPELYTQQPIDGAGQQPPTEHNQQNKGFGLAKWSGVTVKGSAVSESQRKIINQILNVGVSMNLPRKDLVMAIMCGIQESTLTNLGLPLPGAGDYQGPDPNKNPVGVFQQIKHWGWPASRDVSKDAKGFFDKLWPYVNSHPGTSYADCIEGIQNSGLNPGKTYGQWRTEAERIVTAYGVTDGSANAANAMWAATAQDQTYEFYRGLPDTSKIRKQKYGGNWGPEDSWTAIRRMAREVQWRAFFVSGVFYFIADDDLFKSQPIAIIDEDTRGIDSIDGDYDEASKVATLTVKCRLNRWAAPPGSVIQIKNMGPWDGRWIVNDVERSAFDPNGTVTLKKPWPRLPEPSQTNIFKQGQVNQSTWHLAPMAPDLPKNVKLVQPVPDGYNTHQIQGIHDTMGLAGEHFSYFKGTWPHGDAVDFGGDAGAPVIAPESGKIIYFSGHDPANGPTQGVHGPFGWTIYMLGNSGSYYFITHLGTRTTSEGLSVQCGEQIGTIGDYAKWGGANHTHVGVNPQGPTKHPNIEDLMTALTLKKSQVKGTAT